MLSVDLISVHVPKCAGVSLRTALEQGFGSDAVYRDYDDKPADPASPMNLDPDGFFDRMEQSDFASLRGKRAIHGHFNILKYRYVRASCRITFLRDPVDRMISHYFYWQTTPRHGHRLHDYCLDYNVSVDDFARLPMIRGFYTSVFFSGVDMQQFDLIGFHDRLAEDYEKLQQLIHIDIGMTTDNKSTFENYENKRDEIRSDAARMSKIRDLLKSDIVFYEKWRSAG